MRSDHCLKFNWKLGKLELALEMKKDELTKDQLLNYLSGEKNLHEPLIQRKEIAAWSFTIFYVASIWTLYSTFLDNKTLGTGSSPLLFSIVVVVLLGYVAFMFVRSQYASIYFRWANTLAIDRAIYKLMEQDFDLTTLDFSFDTKAGRPKFLSEELFHYLDEKQPFRGKIHPLKILLRFWSPWHFVKLNNTAKQEASLYSIIILVTIAYAYLVLCSFC